MNWDNKVICVKNQAKQPLSITYFILNRKDVGINVFSCAIKINFEQYLWLTDPEKWHTL